MRTSILWLVLLVTSGAVTGRSARAEDEPAEPPSITYPASRESKAWIGKPGGTQVAVDEGIAWKGVQVYLSLTHDLLGVDVATGKTLYAVNVGAFWNALTFKEVTPHGGGRTWAVQLSPGPRARQGADRRQYHDLRTGKKLQLLGPGTTPAGQPFRPRANWHGDKCDVAEKFTVLLSTERNWVALQEHMFGVVDPERFGPIDFESEVVLVVSRGNTWNWTAIDFHAGYEDTERILLRTKRHTFQTINGAMKARPWGIFVLPRRAKKAYVVESNAQNLIHGPPIWRPMFVLDELGPAESELAKLPPRTDEPHHGWDGDDGALPPPRRDR